MNPTRRWFVKAFSGAILTALLGVKAWRLEVEEEEEFGIGGFDSEAAALWDPPFAAFEWSNFEAQDEYTACWVTHHADGSKTYGEPVKFRIHTNGQPIPADWS